MRRPFSYRAFGNFSAALILTGLVWVTPATSGYYPVFAYWNNTVTPYSLSISAAASAVVSTCIPVTVNLLGTAGTAANAQSTTSVALTVNNGTGTFYSNAGCSTTATTVSISSGSSTGTVYFSSPTANQLLTLVTTATGLVSDTSDIATTAAANHLTILGETTTGVNHCTQYQVARLDTNAIFVAAATAVTVNLTQNKAAVFYSNSTCATTTTSVSIPAYQTSGTFYIKDGTNQNVTLTATDAASTLSSDTHAVTVATTQHWWNASWTKRIRIDISNLDQSTTHTNTPVLILLDSTKISYAVPQSAAQDIRFVASDDSTALSYEIENWDTTGTSYVWVKLASIPSSAATYIFMYYGNAGAADGQSSTGTFSDYWGTWHFQQSPAATAPQFRDSTSNVHHGTATGGPGTVASPIYKGIDLNADNDVIDMGTDLSTVLGVTSTLSAWIKTTQVGDNTMWLAPGITGVEEAGGGNDIFFGWIDASGYIGITAGNGAAAKSNFVVNDGNWRYVTITRSATTGAVQFYVNGVQNGTGTSETGNKTQPFQQIGIIADTGGTPQELDAYLDELRISNSVVSAARIRADYKYMVGTNLFYNTAE